MTAGVYDIKIEQGAAWDSTFTYEDPSGAPIDLTGWTAVLQIRRFPVSAVMAELSTTNGRLVLASDGTITAHLPASVTATLLTSGYYDLRLVPPAGDDSAVRLLEGRVKVDPAVTRSGA